MLESEFQKLSIVRKPSSVSENCRVSTLLIYSYRSLGAWQRQIRFEFYKDSNKRQRCRQTTGRQRTSMPSQSSQSRLKLYFIISPRPLQEGAICDAFMLLVVGSSLNTPTRCTAAIHKHSRHGSFSEYSNTLYLRINIYIPFPAAMTPKH